MASRFERQVALQLGIGEALIVAREFARCGAPAGRQVLGLGIVFVFLSLVEAADERWQRAGALMGWLVVMGLSYSVLKAVPTLPAMIGGVGAGSTPLFPARPGAGAPTTSAAGGPPVTPTA